MAMNSTPTSHRFRQDSAFLLLGTLTSLVSRALLAQRDQGTRGNIISVLFHDQNAVPIGHEPIIIDQKIVGKTTSAAFGHRIGAPIALASIHETSHLTNSNRAEVDIAGTLFGVDLVDGALFDPEGLRMKRC